LEIFYLKDTYSAFGLTIASDFHLPELKTVSSINAKPDVWIERADLKGLWETYDQTNAYHYIKENFCLFRVPGVAIYKIESGREITVSPIGDTSEEQIKLYLLGTCLGVALMQRKVLPLHGSAIVIDGKAYAIVGESGSGKSTLAAAFIKRGYEILTDDVIAVEFSNDDTPTVIPSYPYQKLWQESLKQFGLMSNNYQSIYDRETKFSVPVNQHFNEHNIPLGGIFHLSKNDQAEVEVIPIQTLECFPFLYYNTYRYFMIERLGLTNWHFEFSATLINKIAFYRIVRPRSRFTANEIVDQILAKVKKRYHFKKEVLR